MEDNNKIYNTLSKIDVSKKVKVKNKLNYLSWVFAWDEVCKKYPNSKYEVLRFENNLPYVYDENTGYMVFTKVTILDLTLDMFLPVMDGANKSMKSEQYTYLVKDWKESKRQNKVVMMEKKVEPASMFDINKTIMRCLTKNIAMFGLGLSLYAGEDLTECLEPAPPPTPKQPQKKPLVTIESDIYKQILNSAEIGKLKSLDQIKKYELDEQAKTEIEKAIVTKNNK